MKNKRDKAIEYFSQKMHCSQAVLAAFSEECGISEEQAFKLGSCFGSGMRKGEVCGACTGALMALGLKFGDDKQKSNDACVRFLDEFAAENGSYICNDLLNCDITTPEGVNYAVENNLFKEFCPKMVDSATKIAEKILFEE